MDKVIRAPYVKVGWQGTTLYVGFGSIQQVITEPLLQDALLSALDMWSAPHTEAEVRGVMRESHQPHVARDAVEMLLAGNYLMRVGDYMPNERYSRHRLYYALCGARPELAQNKLDGATVALVGCGGIGNVVSSLLVAAGVGEILLLDDDIVETSNLTRQVMFTEADVERPKTSALADRLRERNTTVKVTTVCDRASTSTLETLGKPDLLILSADASGVLPLVNSHCIRNSISFLHVCYVEDVAVWGPLVIPGQTGCWSCNSIVADDRHHSGSLSALTARIAEGYQPPSFGPINALASSMAAMDAIKYLTGTGRPASLGRRVGIWTDDLRLEYQECPRNSNCAICAR